MEKLPTAEMSRFNYRYRIGRKMTGSLLPSEEKEMMIEFAKLHVEAALKAAYDNIEYTTVDSSVPYVVKESILNSYSLDNIK